MTINLQTGGYVAPQSLPGARGADTQVVQKQVKNDTEIPVLSTAPVVPEREKPVEDARREQVVRAAQNFVANSYPVGDKTFTIYKDTTGQYITRYKSLRDGKVTYVPEERMVRSFEPSQLKMGGASAVSIQA